MSVCFFVVFFIVVFFSHLLQEFREISEGLFAADVFKFTAGREETKTNRTHPQNKLNKLVTAEFKRVDGGEVT